MPGEGLFPIDGEQLIRREYGLFWGTVVDNQDPERRGRVLGDVPTLYKNPKWMIPVGNPGSGGPDFGTYTVPPIGAQIIVGLIQGDYDSPVFFPGPYALSEAPKAIREAASAEVAAKTSAFETKTFEIIIKDTETEQKLIIRTKSQTEQIEIDAKDGSISLTASHFLILEAPLVSIKHRVQVGTNSRVILPVGNPI